MADETLPLPLPTRPQGATKRCKWCRKTKPLSEFHYRPEQMKHRAECKDCYRAAMNARRDPEDNRARVKAWQLANPEKRSEHAKRNRDRRRLDPRRWIAATLISTRQYCKKRGVECTLTTDEVFALYQRQSGQCVLTGRELVIGSRGQQRDSLSMDRIEPGGPYAIDNIRLVTYQANFARNKFSDDELYAFCEAVLATRAARVNIVGHEHSPQTFAPRIDLSPTLDRILFCRL